MSSPLEPSEKSSVATTAGTSAWYSTVVRGLAAPSSFYATCKYLVAGEKLRGKRLQTLVLLVVCISALLIAGQLAISFHGSTPPTQAPRPAAQHRGDSSVKSAYKVIQRKPRPPQATLPDLSRFRAVDALRSCAPIAIVPFALFYIERRTSGLADLVRLYVHEALSERRRLRDKLRITLIGDHEVPNSIVASVLPQSGAELTLYTDDDVGAAFHAVQKFYTSCSWDSARRPEGSVHIIHSSGDPVVDFEKTVMSADSEMDVLVIMCARSGHELVELLRTIGMHTTKYIIIYCAATFALYPDAAEVGKRPTPVAPSVPQDAEGVLSLIDHLKQEDGLEVHLYEFLVEELMFGFKKVSLPSRDIHNGWWQMEFFSSDGHGMVVLRRALPSHVLREMARPCKLGAGFGLINTFPLAVPKPRPEHLRWRRHTLAQLCGDCTELDVVDAVVFLPFFSRLKILSAKVRNALVMSLGGGEGALTVARCQNAMQETLGCSKECSQSWCSPEDRVDGTAPLTALLRVASAVTDKTLFAQLTVDSSSPAEEQWQRVIQNAFAVADGLDSQQAKQAFYSTNSTRLGASYVVNVDSLRLTDAQRGTVIDSASGFAPFVSLLLEILHGVRRLTLVQCNMALLSIAVHAALAGRLAVHLAIPTTSRRKRLAEEGPFAVPFSSKDVSDPRCVKRIAALNHFIYSVDGFYVDERGRDGSSSGTFTIFNDKRTVTFADIERSPATDAVLLDAAFYQQEEWDVADDFNSAHFVLAVGTKGIPASLLPRPEGFVLRAVYRQGIGMHVWQRNTSKALGYFSPAMDILAGDPKLHRRRPQWIPEEPSGGRQGFRGTPDPTPEAPTPLQNRGAEEVQLHNDANDI